jgi:soluble lytic murein transglycosylase-like protein
VLKPIFILFFFALSTSASAEQITTKYIDEVFKRVSQEVEVPEPLLRAICWNETHFNPEAYNHGDGKGNNHALGICQVLYETARERGFKDENCTKNFSDTVDETGKLLKAERSYKTCKLFGVYTNVTYAAIYLKEKLVQYDGSWVAAIASYNAGALKYCKRGYVKRVKDNSFLWRCKKGEILNQKYVDDVLQALQENH